MNRNNEKAKDAKKICLMYNILVDLSVSSFHEYQPKNARELRCVTSI